MALTDIDLVTLAKTREDDAPFTELVRRHQAGLRAFLRQLGRHDWLADDLAQETFMKAHARLRSFQGGSSFRSWLYAIAYREFLQAARKAGARDRLAGALQDGQSPGETVAPSNDASIDLRRALTRLGDDERAAILLCDAVGMSHAEAAAALALPLGTVKSHILRSREKLREALNLEAPSAPAATVESKGAVNVRTD
ncbi:MAG: sigma-70 family RNA polymerase sigma factor [Alphaproteobacteria bacterium]|nr:sigma-70 family RNA polymerase sigma factor [Alphaproteobacteria bacterium]